MNATTTDTATTLERIEAFHPERTVKVGDLAEHLGLGRAEVGAFRKLYGLEEMRYDPELTLFDLALPPARRALEALPVGKRVDYVVYAHTIPTLTPPDMEPAQIIRDELGLTGAEAFAVSQQACVSNLGAIDMVAQLLRAESDADGYALVVTGERAFSPAVQLMRNSAVMADAGAACLVTLGGEGDVVRSYVSRTLGEFSPGLLMSDEENRDFGLVATDTRIEIMRAAVAEAGLAFDDIELVLPHNVNALSWKRVIDEMGIAADKIFLENVPRYSHCYTSDVFVNYATVRDSGRLIDGKHYLFVSVGIGATFGAMVVTHRRAK
ncbi:MULTISPECIES: 3-oxoacyl-ACP synthase III family protein [unclassified Streptomyces]|uniref:3-oxoacyl-ACP synthase III family protein n=1 Tax=unclassified Streptomyces TaxID=2593676 RepID=UPI003FD2B67B